MAFHLSCTLFSVKVLCLTHYHGLLRWDIYSYRFYIVFWRREFEKNFCFAVCQVNCSNYSGDCLIPNTMRNAHEMHNIFAHEIQYGLCGKYPGCIRSRELLSAAQLNHNTMDINLWIGLHFHFQCEYQNIKENTFGRNPQCTREIVYGQRLRLNQSRPTSLRSLCRLFWHFVCLLIFLKSLGLVSSRTHFIFLQFLPFIVGFSSRIDRNRIKYGNRNQRKVHNGRW